MENRKSSGRRAAGAGTSHSVEAATSHAASEPASAQASAPSAAPSPSAFSAQEYREGEASALRHANARAEAANKRAAALVTQVSTLENQLAAARGQVSALEKDREASASKSVVLTADLTQSLKELEQKRAAEDEQRLAAETRENETRQLREALAKARGELTEARENLRQERRVSILLGVGLICTVAALVLILL